MISYLSPSLIFLLFLLLSTFLNFLQAMTFNGYQIRDVDTNNDNIFLADANAFTPTALRNGVPYSVCSSTYLVGGYDVLGYPNTPGGVQGYNFAKTYYNLPPHQIIYYTINFWLLDGWQDPQDTFQLQFDSTLVQGWTMSNFYFPAFVCGNGGYPDLSNMMAYGAISHKGPSLTLKIISQLDSDATVKSLGFRDINLIFGSTGSIGVNEVCGKSSIFLLSDECSCPAGQYPGSTCQSCDPSCSSCFGPSSAECYQCAVGYSFVSGQCIQCSTDCAVCTGPSPSECISCLPGMFLLSNGTCVTTCPFTSISHDRYYGSAMVCDSPCPSPQYFYRKQTCGLSCPFPMKPQTLASGAMLCLHPCETGGFLYLDGTCGSFCPSPLQQVTYGDVTMCINPCASNEFLYWNGSCNTTCGNPLIQSTDKEGNQFCNLPCSSDTDYVYPNNTCLGTCASPFVSETNGGVNYCQFPCSGDEFLFQDDVSGVNSCLTSCSSPYVISEKDGIKNCLKPCRSSEYLFANGTCGSSCPKPYNTSEIEPGVQFCYYMCEHYGEYYYPVEDQCFPTCDPPYEARIMVNDVNRTWYMACVEGNSTVVVLPPEVAQEVENTGGANPITVIRSVSGSIVDVGIAISIGLSSATDSSVMGFILMSKILNFMRYLDIEYPLKLQQDLLKKKEENFYLNFGPGMWDSLKEKFTEGSLPEVFEKYNDDLHSRFLVNFFKPITSCLIASALLIIFTILKEIFVKKIQHDLVKILMRRVELFLKWNAILFILVCNIDEITFYSILEYKTLNLDSFQDWTSLSASLFMVIVGLIILVCPFYLLQKIYQARFNVLSNRSNERYYNLLKRIEGFKLLWADFKDSSLPQRTFFSLFILRTVFIYLMVGLLYPYPLIQTIIFFTLSLAMLCYIIRAKPHRKTQDLVQNISYEALMLIVSISLLILEICSQIHSNPEQLRIFLGDVIIFCNTLVTLIALLFLGIKLWKGINHLRKSFRTHTTTSWSKLAITLLKEDDLVTQELGRNERTSTKFDLVKREKTIENKDFASYSITPSSQDTPSSLSGLTDLPQSSMNLTSRRGLKRLRPSLFSTERQKLDLETSVSSIILSKDKPVSLCADNSELPVNVRIPRKIKERLKKRGFKEMAPLEKPSQILIDQAIKDGVLETIKELDSIENTENRMKEIETLQEEMSPLIVVNGRLSRAIEKK